ncbi:Tyrosine-sulfated glycopeptide receptor 1, partial [Cucurbita argyrosperma subsp. argyrosperma]
MATSLVGGLIHQPLVPNFSINFNFLNLFVLTLLLVLQFFPPFFVSASCNPSDRDSLWSFINSSSSSVPQSFNWSSSIDCCFWEGVSCEAIANSDDNRVTKLLLPSRGLRGEFSSSLTNLAFLSHLDLSHNRLDGSLPSDFFTSLSRLKFLNLSYNLLAGQFPPQPSSSGLVIETLDLSSNRFSGEIPSSFIQQVAISGSLTSFNVNNNSFTGLIPTSFCVNTTPISSLRLLDFSNNKFSRGIPQGLGNCPNLEVFRASFNSLTGSIPSDLYNVLSLKELSLHVNHLSGNIGEGIVNLTNLRILELYSNALIGPIPMDIGKLSRLEQISLHINNLTGTLPASLMNCTNLTLLNVRVNKLQGDLSNVNFSRLLSLTTLDLGNNMFTGSIPSSLYSCRSLKAVRLASNQFSGEISQEIAALQSLSFLSVSKNNLTNLSGALRSLMGCRNLGTLVLSSSYNGEALPDGDIIEDANAFQNIQALAIGACQLTGRVPSWIEKLRNLEVLDLSFNRLVGSIPEWLGDLPGLFYVDLSNNRISGKFPIQLCRLKALMSQQILDPAKQSFLALPVFVAPNNATNQQYNHLSSLPPSLYLGNNTISGPIPLEIGQLKVIHTLDLSNNSFSGSIPDTISNLSNLEILDLSHNHLTGEIPHSLSGLHFLSRFSVAFNDLQGPIPTGSQFNTFPSSSYEGNSGLCGPAIVQRSCPSQTKVTHSSAQNKSSSKKLVIGLVLGTCLGMALIVSLLALWILSKRRIDPRGDTDIIDLDIISISSNYNADNNTSIVILFPNNANNIKELTISDIMKATGDFNQENIIGCGGFGLVYKATLANGTRLAVKKLSGDLGLMEREFKAEVEALSAAKHQNLVTLQGYCVHEGSRLLMYSYMENGSLDYWLHEKVDGASQLDWPTRLKILRGASSGLAYMHQICEPHIVHRDIKSSNILLDEKFEAHVADFGLSRLINPYQTHVTTELVGTLGYIPPEYGQAWVATLRGDMYSFGVVMLELLTGKRPVEITKPKASREVVGWVQQMRNEGKQDEVFDPILRGKGFEEEMLQVLDVACMCVSQNPFKRPTIKEVVDWLKDVGATKVYQNKDV